VNNSSGYANPSATGADSVAMGGGAVASAANTVAVGSNARATGTNAIAIGAGAVATGSVAVGTNAAAANGGSALGDNAAATGTASVALGKSATATGANSVAVGSNSTDGGQNNVVSVGASGNERRVTNVAAGVNATDAVNVSQLNSTAAGTLASANSYTDSRINDLSTEAHRAIAGAVALSRASIPLNPGESGIALGLGSSRGQGAVALAFQHSTTRNVYFNVGVSITSGSTVQAGGGIEFKF